jgi:hypothetical protein
LCTAVVHGCCARLLCTAVVHGCCARLLCTAVVYGCCVDLCQFNQYTHPLFFLGLQLFYPTDIVPLFVTLVEGTSGPLTRFLLHPLLARLAEDDLILTLFPSNGGANGGATGGANDVSAAALVAVAVNFLVSASNHDLVEGGERSRDVQKSEANRRDLSSSLIEVILCVQKHLLRYQESTARTSYSLMC